MTPECNTVTSESAPFNLYINEASVVWGFGFF